MIKNVMFFIENIYITDGFIQLDHLNMLSFTKFDSFSLQAEGIYIKDYIISTISALKRYELILF